MNAAARVLAWVRQISPERVPDAEVHRILEQSLDRLDEPTAHPHSVLAIAGLELCNAFGWGLDLTGCVGCGAPCPEGRSAYLSPVRGGLVCSACGRGEVLLESTRRAAIARALGDPTSSLGDEDAAVALGIVEQTLLSHANVGQKR
jgi:DNA repair protein RecO (recombination protein O)